MAGSNITLLENLIDYSSLKNKVISKNIANVGTVNYKREDVVFKDVFKQSLNSQLKITSEKHLNSAGTSEKNFEIKKDTSRDMTSGINNVDIDYEMSQLAENTLRFKFAAQKINRHYKSIQSAIKGGGQ